MHTTRTVMFCNTELDCLHDSINIAYYLSEPLFYICFLAISLSLKNIPGRYWLVSFLVCCLVSSAFYNMYPLAGSFLPFSIEYYQAYLLTARLIYNFSVFILLPAFLFNLWSSKVLNTSAASILLSWRGRVTRSIYWFVAVSNTVLFISIIHGLSNMGDYPMEETWFSTGLMYLTLFVVLGGLIWINLMVTIKRWHDLNISGWMTLCFLIPFIGSISCIIYLGFAKGKQKANRFGEALTQ